MVSPIIDSMDILHNRSYSGISKPDQYRKASRRSVVGFKSPFNDSPFSPFNIASSRSKDDGQIMAKSLCMGCNTSSPFDFTIDEHNFKVCKCGVVSGLASYGVDYKEVNSTETSDARADVRPNSGKDPIDHSSFRREQSVVPEKARKQMGHAPDIVSRAAVTTEEKPLGKKYQRKLTAVMEELAKLTTAMKPVDAAIAREIRINADRVFRDSVEHFACCNKPSCELALFNKTARVIATKSFVYTLEKLCNGDGLQGVTKQTLTSLHQRVQSSQAFNLRQNPTQHESCLAMIASLDTQCVRIPCQDVEEEDDHSSCQTPVQSKGEEMNSVPLARQASNVQSSPIMQIRDAISRIGQECSYPQEVRDKAVATLQDPEFANAVKNNSVIPSDVSKFGAAYILLRSVAEQSGVNCSSVEEEHAARVGLFGAQLEKMVIDVKDALPLPKVSSSTSCDDDDLLY